MPAFAVMTAHLRETEASACRRTAHGARRHARLFRGRARATLDFAQLTNTLRPGGLDRRHQPAAAPRRHSPSVCATCRTTSARGGARRANLAILGSSALGRAPVTPPLRLRPPCACARPLLQRPTRRRPAKAPQRSFSGPQTGRRAPLYLASRSMPRVVATWSCWAVHEPRLGSHRRRLHPPLPVAAGLLAGARGEHLGTHFQHALARAGSIAVGCTAPSNGAFRSPCRVTPRSAGAARHPTYSKSRRSRTTERIQY